MILGVVAVYALAYYCKQRSPNKDDVKLREVEKLYDSLPIYPGFQRVVEYGSSKDFEASVGKSYISNAPFAEVKAFYVDKLIPVGWQLYEERTVKDWWRDFGGRELTFRNGSYSIVIEYRGDKVNNPDWNYGVSVTWSDR